MFYGVKVGSLSEVNIDGIIIKVVEKPKKVFLNLDKMFANTF